VIKIKSPAPGTLQKAVELAEKAHRGQKRASGEPYVEHPKTVAGLLKYLHAGDETLIAAILHDTVEDTPTTRQTIAKQFGENVASLIHGMTKISTKELRGRPNLDIKIETLRKIFTAMEQDIRIMVIKLADRLHNMQTIISFPPAKQREYAQQTYDIYVKIADRLSMFSLRMELEALCLQILEPELYQKLDRLRLQNQKQGAMLLPDIEKSIRAVSKTPIRGIHFEDKTWQKLQTQLETGRSTTGISDLLLTIVVPDVDACYQMFGVLHQLWQREHLSFQDFINSPMINGYEGLHTTIILENGTRIRCKIRSEVMQRYSDYGVTTVCFGKDTAELPKNLPWTGRITPLAQATSDRSLEFWQSLQSDILGESIVVHAVDDQALLLPEGATVLDGVFYAYGADALRLKRVLVNGKEMALGSPLPNGVSLSLEIAPAVTARRQWLNWVKTGVATATIRTALASQPQLKKETIGKALLQQVLTEQGKGSIDEFNQASLTAGIQALGYANINEIFVAISDGRLEPGKAYQELFPRGRRHQAEASGQECSMQVYLPDDTVETVTAVLTVCKKYQAALRGLEPHAICRRGIARTFQASRLCLGLSVFDNILIGMHAHLRSGLLDAVFRRRRLLTEVRQALRQAAHLLGLFNADLVDRGFDPVGALPQIDRRRVEICRALAARPRLLLLDEPSAGMNPEETVELMKDLQIVREEIPGLSIIIIEHDMFVIEGVSRRVVAFNYGRKIAEGTFAEVARNEEVREAYLGRGSGTEGSARA